MIDALPCLNSIPIVSEIVDHPTNAGAAYVEIHNPGVSAMSLTGFALMIYFDGVVPATIPLSGTLAAGGTYVIAGSTASYYAVYGKTADLGNTNLLRLDGNDVVGPRNPDAMLYDVYGVVGEPSGSNDFSMAWAFRKSVVQRLAGVTDPSSLWRSYEWRIVSNISSASPGSHIACDEAGIYYIGPWLIPPAPTNAMVAFGVQVNPNQLASNISVSVFWQVNSQGWFSNTMFATSNNVWTSAWVATEARGGDLLQYFVDIRFQGAGTNVGVVVTVTNEYAFAGVTIPYAPRFNEIRPNDDGVDDCMFVELIAPAGLNLANYKIVHYNGADTTDGPVWTFTFPTVAVPDDGVTDTNGTPLGFVVVAMGTNTNGVANVDFWPWTSYDIQNGPDGLILLDPNTQIVDAVAWGGAGDLPVDDPGTVVTNGDPRQNNYLHVTVNDDSTDKSVQAPNNVFADTGSGWFVDAATPGAPNIGQSSGAIVVTYTLRELDPDEDGLALDSDNCPTNFNPSQADADRDGIDDACDSDLDGDGVLNMYNNCVAVSNAAQSDADSDGWGDLCDPDADSDGIENDADNCWVAYNPDQTDTDGDGVGDACDSDDDNDGIADGADNCPLTYNQTQSDMDTDGIGDACDGDRDGDGVPNATDNCPDTYNPSQQDINGDGVGDACASDTDGDGVDDRLDNCVTVANPSQADTDHDGLGDACDSCTGFEMWTNKVVAHFETGLPSGWTVRTNADSRAMWRFDDPLSRGNLTGGTGNFAIAESAIINRTMDTELRTPAFSCASATVVELEFKTDFRYYSGSLSERADVDVSINGALGPWSNVWRKTSIYPGPATVILDLSSRVAGRTNVMIRFHYYNAKKEYYWEVDEVVVRCKTCDLEYDGDGDGVRDADDNCVEVYNPNQADLDGDGIGDACDNDHDGDGMLDVWENSRGLNSTSNDSLADPDGDGMVNYGEYVADTDPFSATSLFTILNREFVLSNRVVRLAFPTSTNRRYEIYYNDNTTNLETGWYRGSPPAMAGAPGTMTYQDALFASSAWLTQRLYRVRVLLP